MRTLKAALFILAVLILVVGLGAWLILQRGFSAREEPSRLEAWLASNARRLATPSDARSLENPFAATQDNIAEAQRHFVEHCSACHGLDGSGNTTFGRNMYPKAPDLRVHETQSLTDGELYYIISNGVRFTGMPGFGGDESSEEIWKLVLFVRRLPELSAEEMEAMKKLAAGIGDDHSAGTEAPSPMQGPETEHH